MYVTLRKPKIIGEQSAAELVAEVSNSMLKHAFKVDVSNSED
jgi:hypothetical protein